MIDDRISLIMQTEIQKQVKHRVNEVEIKLIKIIQKSIGSNQFKQGMQEILKPETERQYNQ